ncbi:MAG TPA: hypothetical protein VFP78_05755, partial [Solirubrobacteraceae bacterium]|nr:hypothetical protein [Solirubrobacteraceae bacterium]
GVRRVDNRASFATVAVTLLGDTDVGAAGVEEDDNWTAADAADDALRVLEVAAGVLVVAAAVLLPLALFSLLAWLARRGVTRRRRERALDMA